MNEKRIIFPKKIRKIQWQNVYSRFYYIYIHIYLQFYSTSIYLPLMPPEFLLFIESLLSDCIKFYIWKKKTWILVVLFLYFFSKFLWIFFIFLNTFPKGNLEKYCLGYVNLMGVVKRAEKKKIWMIVSNQASAINYVQFLCIFFNYISLQKSRNNIEREREWKINVFRKYIFVVHHFGLSKFGFVLENSGSFWIEYVSCP